MEKRPEIMKGILTVAEKMHLSPNYIRIKLSGSDLENFAAARVGDNNKIILADNEGNVTFPDFGSVKNTSGTKTIIRTYTMRDLNKDFMTVDFVSHGDEGPASRWVSNAQIGDKLGVLMKEKSKPLYQEASHYYITGDHTALPVISVILESIPAEANGKAVIEVFGIEDALVLKKPENMEIEWLFNSTPGQGSMLAEKLRNYSIAESGGIFVYVAAESLVIKEIQSVLRNEKGLSREQWQAYSYWKFGQAEDESSEERRSVAKQ